MTGSSDEAVQRIQALMDEFAQIDAMSPERRALVHEYGFDMIRGLLPMCGEDVSDEVLANLCKRERERRSP